MAATFSEVSHHAMESLIQLQNSIKLYPREEVSKFQQDNPYIVDGYRSFLSAKQCLKSTCAKSNEFLNIWTHAIGFLLFFCLGIWDLVITLPQLHADHMEFIVFGLFYATSQICLACSTFYHIFNCHVDDKVAKRWYVLDVFGIVLGILGCYLIGLYLGFYCKWVLQRVYVGMVIFMICLSGLMMSFGNYFSDNWKNIRICHLSLIPVSGLLPTFHWYHVSPMQEIKLFLPYVLILYGILAVAMLLYVLKYPERVLPGWFDYIGQSHNWWHILVVAALLHWRNFALNVMIFRNSTTCEDLLL